MKIAVQSLIFVGDVEWFSFEHIVYTQLFALEGMVEETLRERRRQMRLLSYPPSS